MSEKRLCATNKKVCKAKALPNYAYCIKHILEDETAPFKRCTYISKTSTKPCGNGVPIDNSRPDDQQDPYCSFHQAKLKREQQGVSTGNFNFQNVQNNPNAVSVLSQVHGIPINSITNIQTNGPTPQGMAKDLPFGTPTEKIMNQMPKKPFGKRRKLLEVLDKMDIPYHTPSSLIVANDSESSEVDSGSELLYATPSFFNSYPPDEGKIIYHDYLPRLLDEDISDPEIDSSQYNQRVYELIERRKKIKELTKIYKNQFYKLHDILRSKHYQHFKSDPDAYSISQIKRRRKKNFYLNFQRLAKTKNLEDENEEWDNQLPKAHSHPLCAMQDCRVHPMPLSNYCFAHILSDSNQKLFTQCEWEGCQYPVFIGQGLCAHHQEVRNEGKNNRIYKKKKIEKNEEEESFVKLEMQEF